jgi:hypothetical protein
MKNCLKVLKLVFNLNSHSWNIKIIIPQLKFKFFNQKILINIQNLNNYLKNIKSPIFNFQ